MSSRAHHESLWEAVPEGLEPSYFRLRRSFLLGHLSAGARMLDVGCGEGAFAAAAAAAGAHVSAVDVAAEPLRRARSRWPELDLRLLQAEAPWPFEDASFDLVWAGEVIEHVADTGGWLSEVRRVLRPGGALVLSTPNHPRGALVAIALWPGAFEARLDPLSDHLRFYTARSLRTVLAGFAFTDLRVMPAGGPPGARRVLLASARRGRWG